MTSRYVVDGGRPALRCCVDWSEQRHHLAGGLGAALATRMLELGWIRRAPGSRAVHLTPAGATRLVETLGVDADVVHAVPTAAGTAS